MDIFWNLKIIIARKTKLRDPKVKGNSSVQRTFSKIYKGNKVPQIRNFKKENE